MGRIKEKKEYVSFYLEKSFVERIDDIVSDPNNIFDDRSVLIRHLIKTNLPRLEEELEKDKRQKQ